MSDQFISSSRASSVYCTSCDSLCRSFKTLSCQHSFCLQCIQQFRVLKDSETGMHLISCPECHELEVHRPYGSLPADIKLTGGNVQPAKDSTRRDVQRTRKSTTDAWAARQKPTQQPVQPGKQPSAGVKPTTANIRYIATQRATQLTTIGTSSTEQPTADVHVSTCTQQSTSTIQPPIARVEPIRQRHKPTASTEHTAGVQPTCTIPTLKPVRILVVGLTGHGKSSLINKMVDRDVACVEHGASACQHDKYVMKYELSCLGKLLYVYDTQGLGDSKVRSEVIFNDIRDELKEVNLILVCHKLYDKVGEATECMLNQVMLECGKDLLKRSVLCYTNADAHIVNDNPIPAQKDSLTAAIKPILTRRTLTEEEFDAIPICLTSTRVQDLPTAPNWLDTFWERCGKRLREGSAPFHEISWFQRHKDTILITAFTVGGGIVGGVLGSKGAVIGAGLGSAIGTACSNYKS